MGRPQRLRTVITMLALAWVALIVLTPQWTRPGATLAIADSATDRRAAVAALVRMAGARVCHQRPERSFHLHGQPLPVCGRCTGLYVSGALGLLVASAFGRRRPPAAPRPLPVWWPAGLDPRARGLALAAFPTAATWASEVARAWDLGTVLRAITALPLGLVAGWLIGRALREE